MKNDFIRVSLMSLIRGMLQALREPLPIFRGLVNMLGSGPNRIGSIGRLLEEQAHRYPLRPAIRFGNQEWTYAELNARANQVAALLAKQGIQSGDVVGVMMETRPELLACVAGAVKLGAVVGMINYHQRDDVLSHSIGLIKPKAMIVSAECVAALATSAHMPGMPAKDPSTLYYWVPAEGLEKPAGFVDLEQQIRGLPESNPTVTRRVKMSQPCFYIFTSGTTGMPKASVMTHYRWLMGMNGVGLFAMRLRPDDVLYVSLPFYHNNALTVSWGSAMGVGACMAALTLRQRLPAYAMLEFLRVRAEHDITGTFKNRKVELKSEGFDLEQVRDPLFYYAGHEQGYCPLDAGALAVILKPQRR